MTEFTNKLAANIVKTPGYSEASGSLFEAYVLDLIGQRKHLSKLQVKKLISSAQIFYQSNDEKLRKEGAILLSMILDICADEYPSVVPIANNVFVNSGDFPNIALLSKRHPNLEFSYSFYSQAQHDFREQLNFVEELDFTLTDYQRALWADLISDKDLITAAPTSAGKTHIILNYLLNSVVKGDGAFVAIIVPTRALISEVAGKIYSLAEDLDCTDEIEICTVPTEGDFKDKTFFVMTQERLYEVLMKGDISFNYFFLDEAHNIAEKGRGVLLHLTIEKMLEDSNPQIIISMPSVSYQNSFSTIFKGIEFTHEVTTNSPVAKVMMSVVPIGKNLVISRENSTDVKTIPKGFIGTGLPEIVYRLGQGQSNIIYRNRTDYCETMANGIAKLVSEVEDNEFLEEAADYVERFVHESFSLADNLRKGVAFHYGPLPSSIRVMIENLVKDDHIKYIACTSTLAEGVNLPAKNLFLQNPAQRPPRLPAERLEDVTINNITGRAGRMLQHFSGNIFLIQPEKWTFLDYFEDKVDEAEKIPTYFKTLNEDLPTVIAALQGRQGHEDGDQYRFYSIANKLLKEYSNGRLEETLQAEELILSAEDKRALVAATAAAHSDLKIPAFTLEANPTTGYIQQNKLFNFLSSLDSYDDWVLPHPRAGNLYDALFKVSELLRDTGVFVPNDGNSLGHICSISKKWVQGMSLKSMISEQIIWEKENKDSTVSVNSSVRNVIKVINNDIGFRLSTALRCYDVLLTGVMVRKGIGLANVKLHSFLEIGACDERMINLINTGLSREAAKELHDTLPITVTINSAKDLMRIVNAGGLLNIHPITKKEIDRLFSSST